MAPRGSWGVGEAAGDRKEWLRRYLYYWEELGGELKKEVKGRTKEGEQVQERKEWRLRAESKWWGEEEVRWKTELRDDTGGMQLPEDQD